MRPWRAYNAPRSTNSSPTSRTERRTTSPSSSRPSSRPAARRSTSSRLRAMTRRASTRSRKSARCYGSQWPQGGIMNSIPDQLRRSSEFRAAGHWGDDTLVTLIDRWADADPGHPYISDGVGELTYGEFRAQAWNLAAALAERSVKPGDRVAVQLPNWNEFFLIYAACARLVAGMIPIVVVYRAGEVGFIAENSGAVALIPLGGVRRV